ncbi:hypothetical protein DFP73DRAFT_475540 [Morchella snyderi]|nr:hypothetical protein DFP73DRAFT_475540 [Morchella snyderi]
MYTPYLLLLSAGAVLAAPSSSSSRSTIKLPLSSHPPSTLSPILDRALGSLSIELSYFTDFAGNLSNPNTLFARAINNLYQRTGKHPDIRPGGITADSAWFVEDAPAIVRDLSASGGIYRTTLGPAWYESFSTLPCDIHYVVNLNFQNNSLALTTEQMRSALQYIPHDQIDAFELGNEGDHYPSTFDQQSGNGPWSMETYTIKYLNWTSSLAESLNITEPIFSAGTFADDPPSGAFNITGILSHGADSNGLTVAYSQHMYQYSTCDPARNQKATLENLVNHANITSYVDLWIPQIQAADAAGGEFFVGEYNSVSCSGKLNVTDTFGQALWVLDTTLWAAYRGAKRMYLHNGATLVLQSAVQANTPGYSKYNLIMPHDSPQTGPARLSPSYVGYLMIGEAVGASGESRLAPIETGVESLGVYGVWEQGTLQRIVALNMDPWNGTSTYWDWNSTATALPAAAGVETVRPGVVLDLGRTKRRVVVKRMTAPGLNEKNPHLVTWAGQEYYTGAPVGKYEEEVVRDGKVFVGASEAVLIFLDCDPGRYD